MGFRFWRRVRILPGVSLNLSKSGASLSFGPRGARYTIGPRGTRATVGMPGTGLFYTTTGPGSNGRRKEAPSQEPKARPEDRLSMGFFKRLVTDDGEEAFVDGTRELHAGNSEEARRHLARAAAHPDGAFVAGYLAMKENRLNDSAEFLTKALENPAALGELFDKYGVMATITVPVTEEVAAHALPTERGALLLLAEVYQGLGYTDYAMRCLTRVQEMDPGDVVAKVSVAELLLERDDSREGADRVVRLAQGVENESALHAALMLYQGRALRRLGLGAAARDVLTEALRRRKGRPEELLKALRYERALVYTELGQRSRARSEFGRLYAEDPDYEDVAERVRGGHGHPPAGQ